MSATSFTVVLIVALVFTLAARAQVAEGPLEYEHAGMKMVGYLATPEGLTDDQKLPGVVVVPEWWGLGDYAKARARQLAELGYVALAVDMYGEGRVTADREQAGKWAGVVRGDKALMRARAAA